MKAQEVPISVEEKLLHEIALLRVERERDMSEIRRMHAETHARIDTGLAETHARIDTGLAETQARIDTGLAETHARIDKLEGEIKGEITGLRGEITGLRGEMKGEITGLKGQFVGLKIWAFFAASVLMALVTAIFLKIFFIGL